MKPIFLLPFGLWTILLTSAAPAQDASAARSWLIRQGYAPPSRSQIVACHGYGCTRRTLVTIESGWLSRARTLLGRVNSPAQERQALATVVGQYTAALAAAFGGPQDRPRSPPSQAGKAGQMDCLDATANVISLLLVLEERGLLTHHRIDRPRSRGLFFDGRYPHFSAAIRERRGGAAWMVDPWTRPPGQKPDILPLPVWQEVS